MPLFTGDAMLRVALSIAKVRDSPDAIFITAKLLISIFVQLRNYYNNCDFKTE